MPADHKFKTKANVLYDVIFTHRGTPKEIEGKPDNQGNPRKSYIYYVHLLKTPSGPPDDDLPPVDPSGADKTKEAVFFATEFCHDVLQRNGVIKGSKVELGFWGREWHVTHKGGAIGHQQDTQTSDPDPEPDFQDTAPPADYADEQQTGGPPPPGDEDQRGAGHTTTANDKPNGTSEPAEQTRLPVDPADTFYDVAYVYNRSLRAAKFILDSVVGGRQDAPITVEDYRAAAATLFINLRDTGYKPPLDNVRVFAESLTGNGNR